MPLSVRHIPTPFTRRTVKNYAQTSVEEKQRLHLTVILRTHPVTKKIEHRESYKEWLIEDTRSTDTLCEWRSDLM